MRRVRFLIVACNAQPEHVRYRSDKKILTDHHCQTVWHGQKMSEYNHEVNVSVTGRIRLSQSSSARSPHAYLQNILTDLYIKRSIRLTRSVPDYAIYTCKSTSLGVYTYTYPSRRKLPDSVALSGCNNYV